jgi:hypothetical protein
MIYNVNCPVVVSTLPQHSTVKKQLLELIDKLPESRTDDCYANISKTDWNIDETAEEEYLKIIKPILISHIAEEFEKFNSRGIAFGKFWFQQYGHLDTHSWHIHENCHWTNVYFLELPDQKLKTQIQNFNRTGLIDYSAKEGDIVSFPSFLHHKSPINNTTFRKTIISFNTNYV